MNIMRGWRTKKVSLDFPCKTFKRSRRSSSMNDDTDYDFFFRKLQDGTLNKRNPFFTLHLRMHHLPFHHSPIRVRRNKLGTKIKSAGEEISIALQSQWAAEYILAPTGLPLSTYNLFEKLSVFRDICKVNFDLAH